MSRTQAGRKCFSYLKEGGEKSIPRWFPSAELAQRAEKLRILRGCRKGVCLGKFDEFKAVFYALVDTLNQVTVDPESLSAQPWFTRCVSMNSRIFAQQKCARKPLASRQKKKRWRACATPNNQQGLTNVFFLSFCLPIPSNNFE